MHVEMGWICPIWPSACFATKLVPMCKKPCCLAVPLIEGWKIADFLKYIFIFYLFLVFGDFFCRFCAVGHILRLACFLAVLAAPGWQNPAWVAGKTHTLKNWPIYGRYGHIPGTGARFSNAVRGVSRVICGWYWRLDLVSMVHFDCFLSLVQVCYLTPGPKHSKPPFFWPKHHFLTHKRQKNKKDRFF